MANSITKELNNSNLRILQTGLVLFCCIFIFTAWILTQNQLEKSKTAILQGVKQEQRNLTSILAENLFQILEQSRAIEIFAQERLSGNKEFSSDVITSFLYGKRGFNRIVLYDASGNSLYMSSPSCNTPLCRKNMADHIHEMMHNNPPRALPLPPLSPDSTWQLPILFPLTRYDGQNGAMLLELDLGYFLTLFQSINIGQTGRITILDNQGRLLACFEHGGLVIISDELSQEMLAPMTAPWDGVSDMDSDRAHKTILLTSHNVQGYPFTITVSQDLPEILSDYNQLQKDTAAHAFYSHHLQPLRFLSDT